MQIGITVSYNDGTSEKGEMEEVEGKGVEKGRTKGKGKSHRETGKGKLVGAGIRE